MEDPKVNVSELDTTTEWYTTGNLWKRDQRFCTFYVAITKDERTSAHFLDKLLSSENANQIGVYRSIRQYLNCYNGNFWLFPECIFNNHNRSSASLQFPLKILCSAAVWVVLRVDGPISHRTSIMESFNEETARERYVIRTYEFNKRGYNIVPNILCGIFAACSYSSTLNSVK